MKNKFNFKSIILTLTLLTLGVGQMWATTVTVKFKVTGWTKVYAYTWDGDDNGSWPGGEITSSLSNGWYSYNLTSGAKIIFNNNSGKQTNNIENVTEDVCYIWVDDTKKEKKDVNCDGAIDGSDVEYFYRGTSNSWGATKMTQHALGLYSYIGPYSQNDKFKIALSSGGWDYGWDSNVHDLTFNGGVASGLVRDEGNYKISPSGSYYIMVYHPNTSLNSTSSVKINIRSSLYNPSYTITYKDQGNVTYTGSNGASLPTSYTYGTGIASLTDGEKSGYSFGGWFDNPSCTGSAVTSIGTTATGDKTFYAKWTAVVSNTLTVQTDGHGSITTPSGGTTSYTIGTPVSIVAADGDGYTFKNWTVESGTATIASSTSKSTTVTVTAGTSATVQANYTEVKSTVTVNANQTSMGTLKFGSTSKSWGTTASVGVTTTQGITATASSGYIFSRWVLSGGAATSSSLTSGTITLKGDGSGDAGIAKAVFGIEYYYKGGKNGWANPSSDKLTPHESGYYAYYQVNGSYEFKITKNASGYDPEYTTIDNSYGNITLGGGNGSNITDPSGVTHYICVLYPGTDVNDGANPLIFASTTLPDLAPETTYSTTFYAGDHGAINAKGTAIAKNGNASVNIGATARALTATPESGYSFDYWETSGSVTVTDPYSQTTTVSASAAGGTVRAHYLANSGWYLQGGFDDYDTWETTAKDLPVDRPYRGISGVYYRPFSTLDNNDYFGLHDGTNKYSGHTDTENDYNYSSLDQVATLYVNSSKSFQAKTSFSNKWAVINTTGTKTFWIQNPETCHTVTVSNDGTKGTVVLKTDNHGNLTTTQFTHGETIRVEIDTMAHYSIASVTLGATNVTMTHSSGTKYTGTAVMPNNDVTLTVTYTPWYTIHYERVPAAGGKTAPWANTSGNIDHKTIASDATYVKSGTTVYLYAANQSDGYTYYGWYSVNNPGKEDTSKRLGTSQEYSTSITTSGKEFYAIYFENDYTVTVNAGDHGKVDGLSSTTVTGHVTSLANLPTATADPGYYFVNWTTDAGTLTNSTSATTGQINGLTSTATVTANFAPIWTIAGLGGDWNTNKLPLANTYVDATVNYAYLNIDTLRPNTTYAFKAIQRSQGDPAWWRAENTTDNKDIYYSNSNTRINMSSSDGDNFYLHTAGTGTYTFDVNLDGSKHPIKVHFPTSYTVTFGSAHGTVTATVEDATTITTGQYAAENKDITFAQTPNTGYTFKGWYNAESGGTAISCMASDNVYDDIAGNISVYAQYDPETYDVTLTNSGTGYSSGGQAKLTATYDAAFPSITLPTAANGYAFMGYWSAANGEGTQFTDASGNLLANITGYSDASGHWKYDASDLTLYAYYKKAEITNLVLSASTMAPNTSVTATPTISPTPVGPTLICWKILRSNGNLLTKEGFSDAGGNAVSFSAPETSGSYKVACVLRTGSDCDAGTVLDSVTVDFVVAGAHVVTVRYQDGDGRTLAASTSMEGRPLDWSGTINPPTVIGYTFDHWVAGDGVTMSTDGSSPVGSNTTTTATIYIKASYDGNLTAVYTKKNMIYFNNTLGWSDVYVYFYTSEKYWANDWGTGAYAGKYFDGQKPYENKMHGHMTQIEGTNIWYFDYTAAGYSTYANVAFANMDKSNDGTDNTSDNDLGFFSNTTDDPIQVARRGDHKSSLPMFVPLAGQPKTKLNNSKAEYSNQGYWMNYPENTGYTLKIYNTKTKGTSDELQSIPFKFTADMTMPMELTVELDANREYGFEIHRADGEYFGYDTEVLKINASGDEGESSLAFTGTKRTGIQTSVAGEYIFRLNYGDISSVYNYLVGVHYPVAVNDYRIIYKDNATWSNGEHGETWYHPSRAIHKENGAEDIVSFYISKADGASASMKFQYASAIDANGVVTWTDVASGGSIDLSGITESGVYNFYLKQSDGTISVDKIEAYTGNYYIRTDLAGTSGWDNYRATDHLMTYSEFSKSRETNKFGELYTHYYMKWCERGKNVKFVIANNYSSCVSDTLESDLVDLGNLSSGGWLKSDGAADPTSDKYSANIRFMYDERTNKVSRAYMSSSTNTARQFLVLKGNANFWNSDGTDLTGSGESHANHEAIFKDNEDWIYERMIKLTPGSLFKLYACYAQADVSENGAQHFRGTYAEGAFTKDESAIELIGGEGSTCNARIIYDFKTNRLIAAYLPDGSDIDGTQAIKADLMMVREHQGAGQQLTFKDGDAKLTDVYTVYGVMRFNRWILNNRANPTDYAKDHSDTDAHISEYHPLLDAGSQKSIAERGLYWISFPFDVNLSEVFGFGTYGTHWIMMRYNGAERARIGYWKDNEEGFWEYIWDRKGVTLEAGQGYVLALELDLMAANDNTFWPNGIQQVELFFPSTASAGTIKQTNVDVTIPAHECTIDRRTDKTKPDWNKDRRVADSHWNIIGVPSYANYGKTLSNGSSTITWTTWSKAANLPFLYEWNANDNTYTVQSGTTYAFKAMHAYYVQYHGTLRWSLASATPSSIVARRTYADEPQSAEFRLELQQGGQKLDQTFVKLNDDEETQTSFVFGEDMNKEFNAGKANIYSFIEGYMPAAGNSLPMNDQTTVVPVGVKTVANGEYTFAMPEGTNGMAVTLIDNETGIRTNLELMDYTVTLTAGTYDQRFTLEIPAISSTPTAVEEVTGDGLQVTGARKVLIDNKLYIIKGDKIYDARGAKVK